MLGHFCWLAFIVLEDAIQNCEPSVICGPYLQHYRCNSDKCVMEATNCFLVGLEVHTTEGNQHLVIHT